MKKELREWALRKDADGSYDYQDIGNCALAQFLRETSASFDGNAGGSFYYDAEGRAQPISRFVERALEKRPHTFGALAARLAPATT